MPSNVTALAEVKTAAVAAGRYEDVKADLIINSNVKRLWFRADRYDRYVECNESDNLLKFDVR